ncbi:hypothetical protein Sjap_006006 [Stephania japonica]|uniref:FAR1 domain-containing protein n=1 Tax=Stephania japonica TaxID=461633 RepID=A0AAP0K6M3_9MAGN
MDIQNKESLLDSNETSEQSYEQLDSEGEHGDQGNLQLELQTGCHALMVPESGTLQVFKGEVPEVGMIFDSEMQVYEFYNTYARSIGFSIRRSKMVMRKDKTVTRRVFCCSKEGFRCKHPRGDPMKPRPLTRTGCKARIGIHLQDGKYLVNEFVEEHNHSLARPSESHLLRSQRKMQDPHPLSIEDILSYLREEGAVPQDLNLVDETSNNYLQRWCYEILKKAQEDKRKIRELSTELQRERKQCAIYKEQLNLVLQEMEDHTHHLSDQVKRIVHNMKEVEPHRSRELS